MRAHVPSVLLALGIVTLAFTATADAVPCGPTTCAPLSSAIPGSRTLLVRPSGQQGPLVSYDIATGRIVAQLAAGVLSADGTRFVTASNGVQATRVTRFDPRTGARLGTTRLKGWNLRVGAVSADARYAALVDGRTNPDIAIVDLERGRLAQKIHLAGNWEVDALSPDGRLLYLLEYEANGDYHVRVHDAERGLVHGAITDPKESEPMTGIGWSSVGSRDGDLQLTLYLTSGDHAFVHALSLRRAQAACIDLPGGDFVASGRYALVLAPDGRMLYAANPSLGVVAVVDLRKRAIASVVRFPKIAANDRTSAAFGAISRDGRTVYFTAGIGLLAYDVAAKKVRAHYRIGAVAGVGTDLSGRTILVVRPDGRTTRLLARSGSPLVSR